MSMGRLRFLAASDLEARDDYIAQIAEADLSKYDFFLYKGDTPDPSMYKKIRREQTLRGEAWEKRSSFSLLEDYPETVAAFTEAIDASRKINDLFGRIKIQIPLVGVLGNSDTAPTVIAPKIGLEPVDFGAHMTLIHSRMIEFKGYNLIGYNGRAQYIDETVVDAPHLYFDEKEAEANLEALFKQVDPSKTIFVTHAPPYGVLDDVDGDWISYGVATYGDKAKDGHIGSDAIGNIAFKYQPLLHTFGHIHERFGVTKKGNTVFFNGGSLGETGEVEEVIIDGDEVTCRWIKVDEL
jgi:Icc-related predicted phosphoesterase